MAEINRLNRAGLRRLVALHPDGGRTELRSKLLAPTIAGPLPTADIEQRFADYLLDRYGTPMRARTPADETWFERSLLVESIAPGSATAAADDLAAIVAAPRLVVDGRLSERALAARFALRADEAIAAAVATLPPDAAVAAIRELATAAGPEEDRLHLAVLQAGRALAWRGDVIDADGGGPLVDRLFALLERASPRPLLGVLAPILGAIAASRIKVRSAVLSRLSEMKWRILDRRSGTSFLDEFHALDRTRALADEDYFMTLPDRHVAEAAAWILGRASERLDRDGFVALQNQVLDGELGSTLLPSFVDGLIAGASLAPLVELATMLLASRDEEQCVLGLRIAAQLPLDDCADACLACLGDARRTVRIRAIHAVTMLEPERAVPALVARLDDPEPDVCASAAHALVELGQRDRVSGRQMPGEVAIGKARERTAAARAAIGDRSFEVITTLLPMVVAETERELEPGDAPLLAALRSSLLGSAEGLRMAATLVREVPDALALVALALAGDADSPSVALSAELRAELASALDPLIEAGGEAGMIALDTLSRFSLGDAAFVERIVDASRRTEGYAAQALTALAQVRRRSELGAQLLAPWLDNREHIAATVMAAAVAGVVLPEGHRLWDQVRELFALGSVAAATAYAALARGARVRDDDLI